MELKSVVAPRITEDGVKRLFQFARATPLKRDCTLFDAGYEEAKRLFREKLAAEVGHGDTATSAREEQIKQLAPSAAELRARQHLSEKHGPFKWW